MSSVNHSSLLGLSVLGHSYLSYGDLANQLNQIDERIEEARLELDPEEGQLSHKKALESRISGFIKQKNDLLFGYSFADPKPAGEGSFAKVWKIIQDNGSSKLFALKISHPRKEASLIHERKVLEFLMEEEKKEGKEYISEFLAFFDLIDKQNTTRTALLFSYYPSDFSQWIQKTRRGLSEEEVIRFLKSGLEILVFLQEKGVIHLDIKPGNFLLTESGDLRLADFGLACLKEEGLPAQARGSPQYISPEFMASPEFCDYSSDLWGLASTMCIAYLRSFVMFGKVGRIEIKEDFRNSITSVFQNYQVRFRQEFPEYLKTKAFENGTQQMFDPPQTLDSLLSFNEEMRRAFFLKETKNEAAFDKFCRVLTQLFNFNHYERISAETALALLNENEQVNT